MMTAITVLIGYLLGSIPFGLLAGRLARGIDVRNYGSHRTGGTNVLRVMGSRWAITVGLLDAAKGAAAVLIGARWGADPVLAAAMGGFAAVVGHIYPIFAGFRGGRGVATMIGGSLAVSPPAGLAMLLVAGVVIRQSRYVSLGSISGAAAVPLVIAVLLPAGRAAWPDLVFALATALLVIGSHKDNIQRLRTGTERRLGQRVDVEQAHR